jgi:putative transposase
LPYSRKDSLVWQSGRYYHIYNRGVQKATLFREEDNYYYALRKVKGYCIEFQLVPIAYCLMPNHYHFLIRQDGETPAGLLPQRVFNGYTKAYNHRYGNRGTLFERRFQAKQIESDTHLLHLCRYIHANPVKDGFVDDPDDWPYSNYLEWIGKRDGSLVDHTFVQTHFQNPRSYRTFVLDII